MAIETNLNPTHPGLPRQPFLETPRLRLFRWEAGDADSFRAISSDPEVMRYINGGRPWSAAELDEYIGRQIGHERTRGFCLWRMENTAAETIGMCGLQPVSIGGREEVEIGWWLAQRYWGQGLGTEAARRVLDFAWSGAKLERVIAIVMPENRASQNIMKKIGMTYEREDQHKGFRVVLYAIVGDRR
ncbi:MAG TPA: GNAT family N-acetyltransferase [Candidatus Acidoferrales bacterium]|nr:GNAT family N-acetyltransferase [Candidatus Acidoferrales bacterium]